MWYDASSSKRPESPVAAHAFGPAGGPQSKVSYLEGSASALGSGSAPQARSAPKHTFLRTKQASRRRAGANVLARRC